MILLFLDGYMKTHMGDSPGESEYNVMQNKIKIKQKNCFITIKQKKNNL